jgi:hypothetical protein
LVCQDEKTHPDVPIIVLAARIELILLPTAWRQPAL